MKVVPILRFDGAMKRHPEIEPWMDEQAPELRSIARRWFEVMRNLGPDVVEVFHDGYPLVLIEDAPFAYVNVYTAHVNVGFFYGALLEDPRGLQEGSGKKGRHVKLRPGSGVDEEALGRLIEESYSDIQQRLGRESRN